MVNKIKLFENWAEEIEVPEYLDKTKAEEIFYDSSEYRFASYSIWNPKVQEQIQSEKCVLGLGNHSVNFKSFSDYDFWLSEYVEIKINQTTCQYKLEDCFGIPMTKSLHISSTLIKSIKGFNHTKIPIKFEILRSRLENLKYCPESYNYDFSTNPLLSYHGSKLTNKYAGHIYSNIDTLCQGIYFKHSDDKGMRYYDDVSFNGDVFSDFSEEYSSYMLGDIKPWHLIYNDPNDVENFTFLFLPFWQNSEKFREKAKEHVENLDMSTLERREDGELW